MSHNRRAFIRSLTAGALTASLAPDILMGQGYFQPNETSMSKDSKKPLVTVGAYYYPWYTTCFLGLPSYSKWKRIVRLRLKYPQKPKAGLYNSKNPKVISEHIKQSLRGGIDFWAVSWWGPRSTSDDNLKKHILKHKDASKLKYAIFYESKGRFGSFDDPSYKKWLPDLEYIKKNYFDHPAYYRINGRPVVFVYLSREYFRNKGKSALNRMREKYPEIYLVGDDVFSIAEPDEYQADWAAQFDAVTVYDVYGQSIGPLGNTAKAIDFLSSTYTHARKIANSVGTAFMPTVAPGYNDTGVRKGHPPRARYFTDVENSKEGDVFRAMIQRAGLPFLDTRCSNTMMITSFNEWYEDSQVEATSGKARDSDTDKSKTGKYYTGGHVYRDYEYLYLDILNEEIKKAGKKK